MVVERRQAVEQLLSNRGDALVVTGLGSSTYDVHAVEDHHANYYLWGAMGGAALVGLGLALAQPSRRIVVITGDGEQLMAFGSLASIAVAAPPNLDIFVLDNEHYAETGMQASHTGRGIDLAEIAAACGFSETAVLTNLAEIGVVVDEANNARLTGPRLYVVKIDVTTPPRSLPPRDAVFIKNRFRSHLGLGPN